MQIFEYPYNIIAICVVCLFVLGAIILYFAAKGLKSSNNVEEKDFSNISKLESRFIKSGKHRENRCVMYISVSLDDYRSLYSKAKTEKVSAAIQQILLETFTGPEGGGFVSTHGKYAYVIYLALDRNGAREIAEKFQVSLTKCLIDNEGLLGAVDRFFKRNIGPLSKA